MTKPLNSKSQLVLKEQNLFMTRGRIIRICSHTILLNKCCILEKSLISKAHALHFLQKYSKRSKNKFLDSVETAEDMDQGDQSEELISEQTLLDTVDVPGLPQQEADRRAAWH